MVKPDAVAGNLQRPFYNIPVGTPVGVGLGDFQCSVLASMSQQSDAGDVNTLLRLNHRPLFGKKRSPWGWGRKIKRESV